MTLTAAPRPSDAQSGFPIALVITTVLAGVVAVLASFSLYLLEDGNPLTTPAYAASTLLRYSYDAAYVSALVVGALLVSMFLTLFRLSLRAVVGVTLILALLVALAGFGGLLLRQPLAFGVLLAVYACLFALSLLVGYGVVAPRLAAADAASNAIIPTIIGACVAVFVALLVNVTAVVTHTLALNPVSHALFMQGQIGDTHLSALLIGMGLEALTLFFCLSALPFAFRRR